MDGAPTRTRPAAHFTAQSGWINDPHGISVVDGRYHLFFQHVPGRTAWAPGCHWGHAVSDDLITWEHRPIALAPGDGDDGVWSGSVTIDDAGEALAFYTSVSVPDFGIGRVRVARPTDPGWDHWEKGDVVVDLPTELDAVAFRDPFVFRDGSGWRMLVGTALRDGTAAAAAFSSPDRLRWSYDGLAAQRSRSVTDPVWTGTLWECPQLFEIDGSHVLITSVWDADVLHHVAYAIGRYEHNRFTPHRWHRLTYGDSYYAPSFFRDRDGQPCLIFWMRGVGGPAQGWVGAHSVPHQLSLEGGHLVTRPHPSLTARLTALNETAQTGSPALLDWDPSATTLSASSGGGTTTVLRRTATGTEVASDDQSLTIPGDPGRHVPVLVDGPVLEVFLRTGCFATSTDSDLTVSTTA
ncbi:MULTISPECIES: glycoside hydrolase family 32 protein [unclassified Actinomyces]|uniref:glycoside hydrolase family 32 protein n=1 Tax=unclassified Actinomyces TaxID=2609248 RepID=UPI002016CA33|nr:MULTISPECIES: glycoside hydrolase family 32 protein [unclassified Actinomyces]MCL3776857.1 glycoside hydrolase family 32 protein [Actinomyces sp. AC-20-1]MCL3790449.1 glycoside hydrolase family 32 protein [Actinomyces sp. 187325]MCL3792736.1 glycoside hydrolase family 32 protein [Actinomyces sp. 186855]MCL3794660.1 glycoside hydrolase family 32 protein [Actinomyces sp. 217892]